MLLSVSSLVSIEILLEKLLYRFLSHSYCITLVSEKSLVHQINSSFVYISPKENGSLENQLLNVSEMGCSDYIVCLEDPKSFMIAFENVVHMGNTRRSDRKIIFLPFENNYDTKMKLLEVLTLKETSFVANLLLILPIDQCGNCDFYDLVTHKYSGPDAESVQPYFMDQWNSCTLDFLNNTDLFPHDMSNLNGKSLKVACFTYKPYVLLDIETSIESRGRDGTEVRIVDEFCRYAFKRFF
ncbi:unnamed protein product [Diatraea saccharalis]|uniref:Uncharacterized protein n=1 Tax=Diatraea saccharalis TaxID=40085 RepID=A0A9N9QWT9_9NEOP|nr:unnamed protein product [Diatraea saccharalis]